MSFIRLPGNRSRNKYNVSPPEERTFRDRVYPSKAQASRAAELHWQWIAGQIAWYLEEVPFELGNRVNKYRADFVVGILVNPSWGLFTVHAEDVKGFETPKFRRDVKLWRQFGPFPLHVISKGKTEVIEGGGGEGIENPKD